MAAITARETTGEANKINARLAGAPEDKQRRAAMVKELLTAFDGGPESVTETLACWFDTLDNEFGDRLDELKKQL